MAYDIGAKIGISGWNEFKRQISEINKNYKSLSDYSAALEKRMAAEGKSIDALNLKKQVQTRQMTLLSNKYDEISDALAKAREKYSENSTAVMRLEGALVDVQNSMEELAAATARTDQSLYNLEHGIEDVGDAAEVADDKVLSFKDMLKAGIASGAILNTVERVGEFIVDIGQTSIEAAADVKAANAQFSQTFGDLEDAATSALRSISDETGIAVTRLQGGYTALYAFTKSVGGDQDTALNIAQRALRAAADSAAYYDRTMEDATETLQSFLKGNYENDAALGIAATETTRNAKANELYAKSFKELTEAQKVDTLLAMVEAGNAASGALGQAAREADSWANVTGEASEAVRQFLAVAGGPAMEGLIPVIQGITQGLKDMTAVASWQELRTGVEGFREGLASADEALAASNGEIAATASLAQQYVTRLREIEGAGLDSAEAQAEYARTVELLNQLMPELGLSINQNTGRLEQNTWAIEDNIDALMEQVKAQARQEYYSDIIAQQVALEKELMDARLKQEELLNRQAVLVEQGAVAHEHLSYAQSGSTSAMEQYNSTMTDADRELAAIIFELAALDGQIQQGDATMAEFAAKLAAAAEATGGLTSKQGELKTSLAGLPQSAQDLQTAYDNIKKSARESIDSQIGLFDKLKTKSDLSTKDILKNWDGQKKAFSDYSENLQKAVDMGLDEALVKQLSDGSNESMLILAELVSGTEADIGKINESFQELNQAKDTVSDAMADIQSEMDEAFGGLRASASAAGYDIVDGLVTQMRAGGKRVYNAGAYLGEQGIRGTRDKIQSHSPSRAYMDIADDSVDGLVLQTQRRTNDYVQSMRALATAGMDGLQTKLDAVAQYPAMVAGTPGYGGTTTNTRNVAYGGISININTQPGQDQQVIADAVVAELTARLGREEVSL